MYEGITTAGVFFLGRKNAPTSASRPTTIRPPPSPHWLRLYPCGLLIYSGVLYTLCPLVSLAVISTTFAAVPFKCVPMLDLTSIEVVSAGSYTKEIVSPSAKLVSFGLKLFS